MNCSQKKRVQTHQSNPLAVSPSTRPLIPHQYQHIEHPRSQHCILPTRPPLAQPKVRPEDEQDLEDGRAVHDAQTEQREARQERRSRELVPASRVGVG